MQRRLWGASLVLCALSLVAVHAAGRAVAFRAEDGRTIDGYIAEAESRPAPAVILVPMLGRPKDDWQAVAQRFADANITALAIDLPGTSMPADTKDLARWARDINAAATYLASRPDVRAGAIGAAGASLGGSLAALAAADTPQIRAVALVSPSLDYRGLRIEAAVRQLAARPALLIASVRDPYAARSVKELAQGAAGPRDIRWSETDGHGSVLLARDANLVRELVEWFQRTLVN